MGVLTPEQKRQLLLIDRILYQVWDPIRVSEISGPIDEYSSYAIRVAKLVWTGAGAHEIAGFLESLSLEKMDVQSASTALLAGKAL